MSKVKFSGKMMFYHDVCLYCYSLGACNHHYREDIRKVGTQMATETRVKAGGNMRREQQLAGQCNMINIYCAALALLAVAIHL